MNDKNPHLRLEHDPFHGIDYYVDTRTVEEVAQSQKEAEAALVLRMAAKRSTVAYFDDAGVCRMISTGGGLVEGFAHSAEVEANTLPEDIYFDPSSGSAKPSIPTTLSLPASIGLAEEFTRKLPTGVVASVNGERQTGEIRIGPGDPGAVIVTLHGRQRGTFAVARRGNKEQRRAALEPLLWEQLDAIWEILIPLAPDHPMAKRIAAIFAEFPK